MSLKEFQIVSKLGQGAYSTVYKVIRLQDGEVYALKRVKLPVLSSKQKQNALNEVRILASIRHPHIICYKEAFIDEASKSLCIVMEFASSGDMFQKISQKQKKNQFFRESDIWNVFIQLVKGLKELHSLQILHRDIKSANVFLHGERIAKLGDMNVSKISEKGLCMTQTGTPYYASPEVWKDMPYDSKSDIWSLGCVLYEMIALKPPFRGEDLENLYKKVIRGIYPRIPSEFSQDLSNLVRSLLQTNPSSRPSCQKILKMPIVIKRMESLNSEPLVKTEMLRTIRADTLLDLKEQLPKANYLPLKVHKERGIKSIIETLDGKERTIDMVYSYEVESLPVLQKDKKIRPMEHSDRVMLKQKQSMNILERDRKKSELGGERERDRDRDRGGLEINGMNVKGVKELKLPKVMNRYNRERNQRQSSLRTHQQNE